MENNILLSESFSRSGRHYYLDFRVARNNAHYITLSRSQQQPEGAYLRQTISLFQEDFEAFVQAFSNLINSAAYLDRQQESVQDMYRAARDGRARGIKSWAPEMRPREKMLAWGCPAMSGAELLAMLIGSGTPNETAVSLAERILARAEGKLHGLLKLGHAELCRFPGMGLAKASAILAAMELARRIYAPFALPLPAADLKDAGA